MDIQIGADTFIDNSVTKFTEFQIETLRRVGALSGFGGLIEPDLMKTRERGPLVVRFFQGSTIIAMVVGLYRSIARIGGPMSPQESKQNAAAYIPVKRAIGKRVFDDTAITHTPRELRNLVTQMFAEYVVVRDKPDGNLQEATNNVCAALIIYCNHMNALKVLRKLDEDTVEDDTSPTD